ncbi:MULTISPECIES: LysR family transcriptional regulator [unclassified Sphingobium]|uniref:LysR family transcriptional regulator n=1 Tax=unclassified Sphingobium TaxID=2611147 RepID=UPI0035A66F8C
MDQNPHPNPSRPRAASRGHWTPALQARFLAALLQSGSVRDAARAVGMSPSSAHRLRRRLAGTEFDANWDEALAMYDHYHAHPLALGALTASATRRA